MDLLSRDRGVQTTGGPHGIGRAIADGLAEAGSDLATRTRDAEAMAPAVDGLRAMSVNAFNTSMEFGEWATLDGPISGASLASGMLSMRLQ